MQNVALRDRLKAAAPQLSVGVLTADWLALGCELKLLESAGIKLLHFDVMDGAFCPTLTLGAPVISSVKTSLLKDVHLMIEEPLAKLESFVAAGADILTVHVESSRHVHRVLQSLGSMTNANDPDRGIVRGLALNPGTPLESIEPFVDEIDMVLLLAVNPGWSGQAFIASTQQRVKRLKERVGDNVLICVDGGVTRNNVANVARMGADIIVSGSAVFDGRAAAENAKHMVGAIR